MANIKASKKDILTTKRNHTRNVHFKTMMKSAVKKALSTLETDPEAAVSQLRLALKTIDKLVTKGILHKGTAARKKSKLMKKANKLSAADRTTEKSEPKKTKKAAPASAKKVTKKPVASKPSKTAPVTKTKVAPKKTKKAEK